MAFLRRPRPFSLSVLSPAESVAGRLPPAISPARAGRAAGNRPERAKAARERRERRFIQTSCEGWILLGQEVISKAGAAYCTGGVRSALLAVLLEARLGIVAANYDGSLCEWSADPFTATRAVR